MVDIFKPTLKLFAQFWFEGRSDPVLQVLTSYRYIWYKEWGNAKNGILQPYLMSFPVMTSDVFKLEIQAFQAQNQALINRKEPLRAPKAWFWALVWLEKLEWELVHTTNFEL